MTKLILLCCTLLISFNVIGQGYNNSYLFGRPACVFRGIQTYGDTILAHGYIADSIPPYFVDYIIAELNPDGSVIRMHSKVGTEQKDFWTQSHFILTEDRHTVFVGINNDYNGGLLYRLNSEGVVELFREYIDSNAANFGFRKIELLPDSSFIVLADRIDGSDYNGTSVLRLDWNGELLWSRIVSYIDYPHALCILRNGSIAVSTTRETGSNMNTKTNARIYYMDIAGNVLNNYTDTTNKSYGWNKYLQDDDGNAIYVSRWLHTMYNDGANPPTFLPIYSGYIAKEDSNHNKIWALPIGQASFIPNLFQLKQLTDGNYLAVGGTYDSTYTNGQPYKNTGWLIKFDGDGNIIWQRKYYNTTDRPGQTNYLYDFVELADGSIIVSGERIDFFEDYPQRGWLLRTDRFGCVQNGCEVIGIDEVDNREELTMFPNPTNDIVHFELQTSFHLSDYSIEVTSMQGERLRYISNVVSVSHLSLSDFAAGIYVVIFKRNGILIAQKKLVKSN